MTLIGLDEAGRGPWAGPLCAAAVAIAHETVPNNTKDSKKLSEKTRESTAKEILTNLRYAIVTISAEEIDKIGLGPANRIAFERAYQKLVLTYPELLLNPHRVLIDGNPHKGIKIPSPEFFQKGEDKFPCIAAASILAKTHRDQILREIHHSHPNYGFESHKGYGTKSHQEALAKYGPLPSIHRRSFAPIAKFFQKPRQPDFFADQKNN